MISRGAQLPRICLACRIGLSQRAITASRCSLPHVVDKRPQRRLASNFTPQSKERMEALISGALDLDSDIKGRKKPAEAKGRRSSKVRQRDSNEEKLAGWELEPNNNNNNNNKDPLAARALQKNASHGREILAMDKIQPETVSEGGKTPTSHSEAEAKPSLRKKTFRHDLVNRQSLGVDALGKPVEAIIIKNPNKLKRHRKPIPVLEGGPASTGLPLKWQTSLPPDSAESSLSDEVWKNIEEIRPQNTKVVRRKDFDKLVKSLVYGFTQEQLVTYLNRGKWVDVWEDKDTARYSWVIRQSPWASSEPKYNRTLTPKQQQAASILTAKWKIEIQEHIEGLGRTVLWLPSDVFQLITRSSSGVIERLSSDFLDASNNERISTDAEEYKLGIYSRKSVVTTILNRLDEIVQTASSQTVSVKHIAAESLEEPVLDELARITKTVLHYNADNAEISVSWLAEPDSSSGRCESPADIVLRLLVDRHTLPHNAQAHVFSRAATSKSQKGVFLIHQREKRGMPWKDKLRQWHRYVTPVGKPSDVMKPALNMAERIDLAEPEAMEAMGADERTETVATFGHILHAKTSLRAAKSANMRRVLSPRIPHPAALTLMTADDQAATVQKTAIVLYFASDIITSTSSRSTRPLQVRLHIPVHPSSTDLSSFSFPETAALEVITSQHEIDMMFPDESVDARLTQTRLLPLDNKQAPLREFLHASELHLLQGKLRTPSRTTFSIAKKWLSGGDSVAAPDQVTHVPYMFMGLEVQHTIDVEWQGHILRYSSIEAGQHGGQQQKLSLIAGMGGGDGAARETPNFIKLVEEIATGIYFSWDEGYKLMQQRSNEQFSLSMMDTRTAVSDIDAEHVNDGSDTSHQHQMGIPRVQMGDESSPYHQSGVEVEDHLPCGEIEGSG